MKSQLIAQGGDLSFLVKFQELKSANWALDNSMLWPESWTVRRLTDYVVCLFVCLFLFLVGCLFVCLFVWLFGCLCVLYTVNAAVSASLLASVAMSNRAMLPGMWHPGPGP